MKREDPFQEKKVFDALLQSVTDYVIAINRNSRIVMANDLFRNEFGLQPGGFCFEAWKQRDEKCEECLVEKSFRDGEVHATEEAVVMKDGRIAHMRVKSTPVKDERGEVVYVLETATDITEKMRLQDQLKRAAGDLEEAVAKRLGDLQRSEKRYRTLFERSGDAILLTDQHGKILEINHAVVEMLGYDSKQDLLRLGSAKELFEGGKRLDAFRKRVSREGFVTDFETRMKGKGGRVFDALITSNVILDMIGQITGYVIIVRDITERKKARQQIEIRNKRLAMLNAISTAVSSTLELNEVLRHTIDKMLEFLEPDSVRIYMFDKERGTLNLLAHKGLSPEFTEKGVMKTRKVSDGLLGKSVITREPRVVDNLERSEDPYVDLLVREGLKSSVYMPLISKGEPVGAMVVSSHSGFKFSGDYVEFLTAIGNQIGVALENANLYENLKRAYGDLKEAQEQVIASEKLASLGKLSATIAHEINNPLAVVLTYVRLMMKLSQLDRFTPERLQDIRRYLNIMESETARCGEIVKNLLTFSRQSKMTIGTHSLEDIIDKTLILISHDLEMKEIRLVKDIPSHLPKIRCDFKQIQQALLNLVGNASEAMTTGGTLTVRADISKDGESVEVVVSDTGCGIPEEDLKNIFEPFFTTKEEGRGVGLGLSVVYGIIARHNGSLEVKSTPGKGSDFKIRLPVA
jgi:PAS domain S-box-containing protein